MQKTANRWSDQVNAFALFVVPYATSTFTSNSASYPTSVIRDLLDRVEGLTEDDLCLDELAIGCFGVSSCVSYSEPFIAGKSAIFLYDFQVKSSANI